MSGPYSKLVETQPPPTLKDLRERRLETMKKIEAARGRPLIIYATDGNKHQPGVQAMMSREDLVPISELIGSVTGNAVDVLIETPGGFAEVAVEIVNMLRPRFDDVAFIVPHMAMSAGTILVMSGDEILMDFRSSLGPIDPQFMGADGSSQAAQALIEGVEAIGKEAAEKGALSPVYLPILRNVDPGKLQAARNASKLSVTLVKQWLAQYKFKKWTTHTSTGLDVTQAEREQRAQEIGGELCNHQKWLSHGRPIKIADLTAMRLKITDYGHTPELQALIWELWVNIHFVLSSTPVYKLYESTGVDIWKIAVKQISQPPQPQSPMNAIADIQCPNCKASNRIQMNFDVAQPALEGAVILPKSCKVPCVSCKQEINLSGLKMSVEVQTKKKIVLA